MELSGQLHAPAALLPAKENTVPIGQETGPASELLVSFNDASSSDCCVKWDGNINMEELG